MTQLLSTFLEMMEVVMVHHLDRLQSLEVAELAAEDHDAVLSDAVLQQMLRVEREELALRTPERLVRKPTGTELFPDILDIFC